jgi:heme/copper-type cytochrome/quinol oxidase subunit 2
MGNTILIAVSIIVFFAGFGVGSVVFYNQSNAPLLGHGMSGLMTSPQTMNQWMNSMMDDSQMQQQMIGMMMNNPQMMQSMMNNQDMMNSMMGGQMMRSGMIQGSSVSQSIPTGEPTQTRTFEIFLDEIKIFAETENESGEEEIVEVEIHQWNPNSIIVNKGDTVVLKISNPRGSIHAFAIPQFGVSTGNLEPRGGTETIEFVADKAGVFTFICNTPYVPEQNWCSSDHATMTGTIIVLE